MRISLFMTMLVVLSAGFVCPGEGAEVSDVSAGEGERSVWSSTFGGAGTDRFLSVEPLAGGGYIVAGCEYSWGFGAADGWVMKLDSSGNKVWSKTFGGVGEDVLSAVAENTDGSLVVAGYEDSWGQGESDGWVMKLDSSGNKVWSRTFGGSADDLLTSLRPTADGGYIVAGHEASWGQGGDDGWVMKLDSSGNKVWSKAFGGSAHDRLCEIRQTADGGYIVVGDVSSWGQGQSDGWVMKLDSSGGKTWAKTFGGTSADHFRSVQQTADGGYIIAGYEASWGQGADDGWVMRLDSTGAKVWARTCGGTASDYFRSVIQATDGGYVVSDHEGSWGQGADDGWVVKLGSAGNNAWSRALGGWNNDVLRCVRETADGGYVLAGHVASWGAGGYDGWVVKLDSSGNK